MAPRADVIIMDHQLINITVQVPTSIRVDHKSRVVPYQMLSIVVVFWESIVIISNGVNGGFEPWGENLPVAERGPLANTKKKT